MNFVKSQLLFGGASDPALQKTAPYFNGESGQTLFLNDLAAYIAYGDFIRSYRP